MQKGKKKEEVRKTDRRKENGINLVFRFYVRRKFRIIYHPDAEIMKLLLRNNQN